jgi:hypothetical protein
MQHLTQHVARRQRRGGHPTRGEPRPTGSHAYTQRPSGREKTRNRASRTPQGGTAATVRKSCSANARTARRRPVPRTCDAQGRRLSGRKSQRLRPPHAAGRHRRNCSRELCRKRARSGQARRPTGLHGPEATLRRTLKPAPAPPARGGPQHTQQFEEPVTDCGPRRPQHAQRSRASSTHLPTTNQKRPQAAPRGSPRGGRGRRSGTSAQARRRVPAWLNCAFPPPPRPLASFPSGPDRNRRAAEARPQPRSLTNHHQPV